MAAMRRTTHVMYVLRGMTRRRASLSMNSATSSSRVKPARTLFPDGRIRGMDTSWLPVGVSMDWNGLGLASCSPISLSLDSIVPKRGLSVQKGLVYSVTHRTNAWDVRKNHTVCSVVTVYQRRISDHGLLLLCPPRLLCDGASHPGGQYPVAWQSNDAPDTRMSVDVVARTVSVEVPTVSCSLRFTPQIPHLIWTGGVLDCFRGCDGAPCRGWIPAFAGMTEVGISDPPHACLHRVSILTRRAWNDVLTAPALSDSITEFRGRTT